MNSDDALLQIRQAIFLVGTGEMTIDEAILSYGNIGDGST